MEGLLRACCRAADAASESKVRSIKNDHDDDKEIVTIPLSVQRHLRRWYDYEVSVERLGLEKYACELLKHDREARRQRLYDVVECVQDEYSNDDSSIDDDDDDDDDSSTDDDNDGCVGSSYWNAPYRRRQRQNKNNKNDAMAEALRLACEECSQPSVLFSSYLARAQQD